MAASNAGLANCGGLFFLHTDDKHLAVKQCSVTDSLGLDNIGVYGGYRHIDVRGRYSESWDLIGTNELDIANVGVEGRFKYISLGVDISNLPYVFSSLSIYHPDSLFRLSTRIGRGTLDIGEIRWFSEFEDDIVHELAAEWESHFLYREVSAEARIGRQRVGVSGKILQTSPENPEKEYYIRDSIDIVAIGFNYGISIGKNDFAAGYTFADADATLYGILHKETSYKRFLYLPIEAHLHHIYASWNRKPLHTDLHFVHLSGSTEKNPDRFYETLAPNRALPTSILKALSFTFLQKQFRVDTDIDVYGIIGGGSYKWVFGNKYAIAPHVDLHGFYAAGEADIHKKIETTILFSYRSETEHFTRNLNIAGSLLSLGMELRRRGSANIALEYGVTQLIPFFVNYRETWPSDVAEGEPGQGGQGGGSGQSTNEEPASDKRSGDLETQSWELFRNGFATHLGISIRF